MYKGEKLMKLLSNFFESLDKIFTIIAGATMFIMMLWIFADVMLRTFFNSPIQGTIEVTGEYLMAILVYLMLSNTQKHGGHVSVDLFQNVYSKKFKKFIKFITHLIAAGFFLTIGILNFKEGFEYLDQEIYSVGVLHYPLAPAMFIISLGIFMLTLRLIFECITILFPKTLPASKPLTESEEELTMGI